MACLVRRHSSPALVVPHHVGRVVVAVRAQRLAELRIVAAVPGEAGSGTAVLARDGITAGVAGLRLAGAAGLVGAGVLADRPGMDGPEGRGGERGEQGRVGGDGGGDALAADEPGADELVGVAAVGFGAAGAGGGAAVAARLVDHPVRHADRGDGAQELAGGGVDVADVAAQPDGAGAGGGVPDVTEPGVVSGVVQPGEDALVGELGVDARVRCSPPCPEPCGFRVREPAQGRWLGSRAAPVVGGAAGIRDRGRGVAPALLGSLAGDAEPHGDVGPGVAECAEPGDGLAGGVLEVVGEAAMVVMASMSPAATRRL